MRIAINAIPLLSPLTGIGHYTRQIIRRLRPLSPNYEYLYYYGYFSRRAFCGSEAAYSLKQSLFRIPGFKKWLRYAVAHAPRFYGQGFDLYFEPNFIPAAIRAKKLVITVHDFSFRLFPDAHPKDRIEHFEKNFARGIDRANHLITDSEYVRAEAVEVLRFPAEKITAIPLGVEHETFKLRDKNSLDQRRRELGLPENFILFVGTREPRKNLTRLLQAYLELPARLKRKYFLLLVGPQGWEQAMPRTQGVAERVIVSGYLDTEALSCVYNLARVFVLPSLYEGFGLPPLEAMACGCPVVVSRVASLPEVCGDAAYYVDPADVSSIAEGITRVLSDETLRQSLIEKGLKRAALFSWDETARKTLDVFERIMGVKG
ncbi:MAG TPA: glycosyltransferase family 1 protein [Candidatus Acidoferrales bacterium]|nr:glycosyltransferase family 1 protein [Candidatus Acidoferrales bacterium]